jgi:hypothetical protein
VSGSANFKMVAVGLLVVLAGACANRQHMSEDHGKSSRLFFAKQHVYARAATGSPSGVDSEEAQVIQANYRKALGAEPQNAQDKDAPSRVLLLRETNNVAPGLH